MNDRSRPKAAPESLSDGDSSSIAPAADDLDHLASYADGAFVVVCETPQGRYRRRVWLTLAPAERAAAQARREGREAVVFLAELKPLYRVSGAES